MASFQPESESLAFTFYTDYFVGAFADVEVEIIDKPILMVCSHNRPGIMQKKIRR